MNQPLRIALVSAFPPGLQTLNEYGLHLANELAARPDVGEVMVLADRLQEPGDELKLDPKIRVERVYRFNDPKAGFHILKALKKGSPDGVIWNLQTASFGDREIPAALGLIAPLAGRILGLKSGVIAHNLIGGIDLENTQLKGQYIRQALVRFGGVVITRALLSAGYTTVTLRSYFDRLTTQYPRADVHLVPHGTFDTIPRTVSRLAVRPLRLATMGKFGTYKRLETMLEAFDQLRARPGFAKAELVIGGTDHPSTPGYLDSLAQARKGDPGVRFHGYVAEDDIPDFFEGARLSVFDYSSTTGSSGVLHQAASYGSVPVFPRIGDFIDLCEDEGLTGAHFQPLDPADLARTLEETLNNLDSAQSVADANRAAAEEMPLSDVVDFHIKKLTSVFSAQDSRIAVSA